MTISQSVHIEINKLINHLDTLNGHGFIPCNIKTTGQSYHHSRDAALIMCSLVNLVAMGKIKFNSVTHIFLHYLHFENKVCKRVEEGSVPGHMFNEHGDAILNLSSNMTEYDILALRLLAFCQIFDLFKVNNSDYLLDDILFSSNLISTYVQLVCKIYSVPCYDMWGKEFGVHYNNVKLYEMALTSVLKIVDRVYIFALKSKVKTALTDIKNLLNKFNDQIYAENDMFDVIIPMLKKPSDRLTTRYNLNPSVLFPYLPIFGYSGQLIKNRRLINVAMTLLANNTDTYTKTFNSSSVNFSLPFISKYGFFMKSDNNDCVISTISTYNALISINDDIKEDTLLKDWNNNAYNMLKRKLIDNSSDIFDKLRSKMSNRIDKSTGDMKGCEYENMTRSICACCLQEMSIREEELNKNNKIFGTLSKFDRLMRNARDNLLIDSGCQTISINLDRSYSSPDKLNEKEDTKKEEEKEEKEEESKYCKCGINLLKKTIKAPDDVSLEILIKIAEDYHCFKCNKNKDVTLAEELQEINLDQIVKIHEPLTKLMKLRGLDAIKDVLLDNIIYFLINTKKKELLHICIMGPPGVGKTVLAGIIAEIYKNLGILSKGHIKKVSRPDLIGKYLGHTAAKTADAIKDAEGGILFIDEVYSLVDRQGRDSFSKECIDTLTQYLTDKCEDLLCVIAGYREDIEEYFFESNKGLERRFAFKFNIEGYTYSELFNIFCDKMEDDNWKIEPNDRKECIRIFENKYKMFKNFGGDVENLVHRYNLVHNRKNFFTRNRKRSLNVETLKTSIDHLFSEKKEVNETWKMLYV